MLKKHLQKGNSRSKKEKKNRGVLDVLANRITDAAGTMK